MLSRMRRILAGVAAALLALPAANAAAETEKELQPYAEAAAGAAASHTNTTQITERITLTKENFFLPLIMWLLNY